MIMLYDLIVLCAKHFIIHKESKLAQKLGH